MPPLKLFEQMVLLTLRRVEVRKVQSGFQRIPEVPFVETTIRSDNANFSANLRLSATL